MTKSLFANAYLNIGSSGLEVAVLQVFLLQTNPRIKVSGFYDEETARGVSLLQRDLGFHEEKDRDGEFGFHTMSALRSLKRIDFSEISEQVFLPPMLSC